MDVGALLSCLVPLLQLRLHPLSAGKSYLHREMRVMYVGERVSFRRQRDLIFELQHKERLAVALTCWQQ